MRVCLARDNLRSVWRYCYKICGWWYRTFLRAIRYAWVIDLLDVETNEFCAPHFDSSRIFLFSERLCPWAVERLFLRHWHVGRSGASLASNQDFSYCAIFCGNVFKHCIFNSLCKPIFFIWALTKTTHGNMWRLWFKLDWNAFYVQRIRFVHWKRGLKFPPHSLFFWLRDMTTLHSHVTGLSFHWSGPAVRLQRSITLLLRMDATSFLDASNRKLVDTRTVRKLITEFVENWNADWKGIFNQLQSADWKRLFKIEHFQGRKTFWQDSTAFSIRR